MSVKTYREIHSCCLSSESEYSPKEEFYTALCRTQLKDTLNSSYYHRCSNLRCWKLNMTNSVIREWNGSQDLYEQGAIGQECMWMFRNGVKSVTDV